MSIPDIPIVGDDKDTLNLFHSACKEPWKVPDMPLPHLRQLHAYTGAWTSWLMVQVGNFEAHVKKLAAQVEIEEAEAYLASGKSGMEARKEAIVKIPDIKKALAKKEGDLARLKGRLEAFRTWTERLSREGSLRRVEP